MKRIILTESQYKRLVRQNLNEQIVVYEDPKDEKDINHYMFRILDSVAYNLGGVFNKNLYVKKIEDGKVYIDKTKYTQEEIDYIRKKFKNLVNMDLSTVDKMFTNDSDLGFDSGVDSDYDWGDEGTAEVEDDESTAEVEDDESTAEIEDENVISYNVPVPADQREGKFLKGQKNEKVDPKYIFNFLVNKGLKDYQACGVLGNMYWESGFNTGILGDQYTSIGICQWHNERFENLIKYSVDRKRSLTNKDIQLDFMWDEELNGVYYNNVLSPLKKSESLSEATFIWSSKFEVCQGCGDKESSKFKKRLKKAEEYFNLYVKEGEGEILDCENCISKISSETKNKYETIINKDNIVDFRWWVNQNNDRVIILSNKYESCCETLKSKRLDVDSKEINDWSLIAFELYGNEWVNAGKPGKPKESNLIFTPPNRKGWIERGVDGQGSGKFGSGRGNRKHKGVDIISNAGDVIVSPIDGYVSKVGYRIYSTKCRYLVGIDITGTGDYEGYKIKLFYVKSDLTKKDEVKKGDVIGTQQSLNDNCYPQKYSNGNYTMKNHVHVEVYYNGVLKNPSNYNWDNL